MLVRDLHELELPAGAAVIVHSSLSSLGWVAGGAQAVVRALVDVIAAEGTLVMPTHSGGLGEPSRWQNPPVPESWWNTIRAETAPFDPELTPTRAMGAIVECFRHVPGVRRSMHPIVSFAALGRDAAAIVGSHELSNGLGEGSPLARMYELDGYVLLIGVGFDRCTALHLAEFRADYPGKEWITQGSALIVDGERQWVTYGDLDGDTDDFEHLGREFAATGAVTERPIGAGKMRLMRVRLLVDFAVGWFETYRAR
jgi:aminoglycoside 3-N-acetyltransferase